MSDSERPALVVFGAGAIVGDVIDCANSVGLRVSRIVRNMPDDIRPRVKSLGERLAALGAYPEVIELSQFEPGPNEAYAIGTSSPDKFALVKELETRFGLSFATLVHRTAYVSPFARLGRGVIVGAMSVIAPGVTIGDHVYVNRGVNVGHDTNVAAYARLMVGCNIGGFVQIGMGATLGLGSSVIQELSVGEGAFVAAGSVVTRDVRERVLVAGVPARLVRHLDAVDGEPEAKRPSSSTRG